MGEESRIEEYLVERVRNAGGEIRKVKWVGRSNAPDRYVMLPPEPDIFWERPCWVELKAPGKKPTAAQKREHERMREFGDTVYVIDSFEKVDHLIERGYV